MRRYTFDQFEFEPVESEQYLEIAISSPREHNEFFSFLKTFRSSNTHSIINSLNWSGWPQVAGLIRELIGLEIPHPTQLRTATILSDDLNDIEVAFAFGSHLIWYHWSTSA